MGAGASGDNRTVAVMTPNRPSNDAKEQAAVRLQHLVLNAQEEGQWQYASSTGACDWMNFNPEQNQRIEDAFRAGKPGAEITFTRHLYTLTFRTNEMRLASGAGEPRPVRRVISRKDPASGGDGKEAAVVSSKASSDSDTHIRIDPTAAARGLTVKLAASVKAHEGLVYCARFDPTGTSVLTGSRDGTMRLWEVDTGVVRQNFDPIEGVVLNCCINGRRSIAASGADDGVVRLYRTNSPEPREFVGHTHKVYGIDFTQDGKRIISGAMDDTIRVWDIATGETTQTIRAHVAPVFAVTASHYSPHIFLSGGDDNVLICHDLRTGQVSSTAFRGHKQTIWTTDIRFDDECYASSGMDGSILLWDPRRPDAPLRCAGQHQLPGSRPVSVHNVEFSPDGTKLITAARDGTWRLWDATAPSFHDSANAQQPIELCAVETHGGVVFTATYSAPRSQLLSIGSDSTVRIWDTALC